MGENKDTFICNCGRKRVQNAKAGCGNLINHIKTDHADWEDTMKGKQRKKNSTSINKKEANIFHWLEWIVMDNLPFTFVEKQLTAK